MGVEAMFELVDYESNGRIEIEELLYGMVQLSSEVRPMSIMELRRIVVRGLHGVNQQIAGMDARLRLMDNHLRELLAATRASSAPITPSSATQQLQSQAPATVMADAAIAALQPSVVP